MSTHAERVDRLRHALREQNVDVLLVSGEANVTYLTGFRGNSSYLLVGHEHLWFLTDSRFTEQAEMEVSGCEIVERKDSLIEEAAKAFQRSHCKALAIEGAHLSVWDYRKLCSHLDGAEPKALKNLVEGFRAVKNEAEIERIRKAAEASDAAFRDLLPQIQPGLTERELASRLERAMQQHGARKASFDSTVAAGARSSLPHAEATDAVIKAGAPVLVDWGATRDLYCSDTTRMVFLAPPDDKWREIYNTVLEAQKLALAAIRDGAPIRKVDAAARDHIADAGYGERFGHGLGHGVGLQLHEGPRLHAKSEETLREGMVVTVEPGIYIPGWGGVRIEDLVCVRKDGAEILNDLPKDIAAAVLT